MIFALEEDDLDGGILETDVLGRRGGAALAAADDNHPAAGLRGEIALHGGAAHPASPPLAAAPSPTVAAVA
jgi:hypothetical protein